MAITDTIRRAGPYTTNGVQTAFPFAFKVFDPADVVVTLTAVGGVETTATLEADYLVALNGDQDSAPGGSVVFLQPLDGPSVAITSGLPIEQPAHFTNNGGFYPRVLNDSLDRLTILLQQMAEQVSRAAVRPLDAQATAGHIAGIGLDGEIIFYPPGDVASGDPSLRSELAEQGGDLVSVQRADDPAAADIQPRTLAQVSEAQPIDIREFATGPIELENAFDLLNKATGADMEYSGNESALNREIVISVPLVFPDENRSVYVRRGQKISYAPSTKQIDLTGTTGNDVPVFRIARKSDGSLDPGGLPIEFHGLRTNGGPAGTPVIETSNVTSFMFRAGFMTNADIALDLGVASADCTICTSDFDQCLTGLIVGGQNHILDALRFYSGSFAIQFRDNAYDIAIGTILTAYQTHGGIVIEGAGIRNIAIGLHLGLLNQQAGTFNGFLRVQPTGVSSVHLGVGAYRNPKGPAVYHGTGTGLRCTIDTLLVDGLKTNPAYDQSTTAAALSFVAGHFNIGRLIARNLTGTPVTMTGAAAGSLKIGHGEFVGNTGGAADIVSSAGPTTSVRLRDCTSDRALLSNPGGALIRALDCHDSTNSAGPVSVASAATITLPAVGDLFYITGTSGITSITANAATAGRRVTLYFAGVLTVTDGSNLILNGNLVTATNTVLTLVSDGTNWLETGRSAN